MVANALMLILIILSIIALLMSSILIMQDDFIINLFLFWSKKKLGLYNNNLGTVLVKVIKEKNDYIFIKPLKSWGEYPSLAKAECPFLVKKDDPNLTIID